MTSTYIDITDLELGSNNEAQCLNSSLGMWLHESTRVFTFCKQKNWILFEICQKMIIFQKSEVTSNVLSIHIMHQDGVGCDYKQPMKSIKLYPKDLT